MTSRELSILKRDCWPISIFLVFYLFFCAFSPILQPFSLAEDPFLRRESEHLEPSSDSHLSDRTEANTAIHSEASQQDTNKAGSEHSKKEPETEDSDHRQGSKSTIFPGYGAVRELLLDYCKALISDGHNQRIQEIVDRLLKEKAECSTCRQLYRALSCKLSTKQSESTGKRVAAEPSTELLAAISEVFSQIADNPDLAQTTAVNLKPILKELSSSQDPISDAYYAVFITYMSIPLEKELAASDSSEEKKDKRLKQKQLDSMF